MVFIVNPISATAGSPAQSGEVATTHDLLPEILNGAAEEARNSSQAILDDDGVKGWEEIQSATRRWKPISLSLRVSSSTHSASQTRGGGGQQARQHQRQGEGGPQTAFRVGHRTRRVQVRDLVCVLGDEVRNWQESGGSRGHLSPNSSIGAGFVGVQTLEVAQGPTEFINPFPQRTTGVGGDEEMLTSTL